MSDQIRPDTRTDPADPTVDERSRSEGDRVDHTGAPVAATSHPVDTDQDGTDVTARDRRDVDQGEIPRDPSSEPARPAASTGPGASTEWNSYPGLLPEADLGSYQQRWDQIQVRFIDEPRRSVREADDLVDELTRRIVERFSSARKDLEDRWETDNEPTTEELRQALQRYRDYFKRIVAT